MGIITVPDFLKNATNVYRTRGYIVKQQIMYKSDEVLGTYLFSCDTYYRCTVRRDWEFEEAFEKRVPIDGKRIPAIVYVRRYVD